MKLSEWATKNGVSYKTAWRYAKSGALNIRRMPTGTILVDEPEKTDSDWSVYARVSSSDQKSDLDRQVARLTEYAAKKGMKVTSIIREIASGMNGRRKGLRRILSGKSNVLVEHRDRLARFGFDLIESSLLSSGRLIVVINPKEVKDDIVRDVHEILVSLCARMYGKRAAANKAKRAMEAMSGREGEQK